MYFKENSLVKVELGVARGKKLYEKRAIMAERDCRREIERALKERRAVPRTETLRRPSDGALREGGLPWAWTVSLSNMEDGAETEAEQIDEETELEDLEEFQDDEEFDPNAGETDLEEAYESFFAEEGPDGEGETSPSGDDGGLAAVVERSTGIDLSEEGFHLVDGDGEDLEAELGEEGTVDGYDGEELADDTEDVTVVEPADNEDGYELVELELDEDDIVRYLEDEDGNRRTASCSWRTARSASTSTSRKTGTAPRVHDEDNHYDLGITKEGVAEATNDMNAIYKDGIAVAAELKDAFDDIKSAFDFSFLKQK